VLEPVSRIDQLKVWVSLKEPLCHFDFPEIDAHGVKADAGLPGYDQFPA